MFMGESRKEFLEFLRNLTPQILFLTLAFILGTKLDLSKLEFSIQGLKNVAPFATCLGVFLGATMANIGLFIDTAITSNSSLDAEVELIKSQNIKALRRTGHLICAAWKHNKPAFFQILLVMAIAEAGLLAVFIIAFQGAAASPFVSK